MTILIRVSLISCLAFAGWLSASAQVKPAAARTTTDRQALIERGRYIVENVAMCELCHTPVDANGTPERSHWLMGGPVHLKPTYNAPNWAPMEPRIAGTPPGTDAEFIRLLTTGISRTGAPPNPPMPPFRMTRPDAEAVLAYLKSLRR